MNPIHWLSTETVGQTTTQLGELTLALVLSSLIGLEREFRMKSAGLRTHTLVGVGAALIILSEQCGLVVHYLAGQGTVREILKLCSGRAFSVHEVSAHDDAATDQERHAIHLGLRGRGDFDSLAIAMRDLRGIISVQRVPATDSKDSTE